MPFRLNSIVDSMRSHLLLVIVFFFPNKIERKIIRRNIWHCILYCLLFPSVVESYNTCGEHGLATESERRGAGGKSKMMNYHQSAEIKEREPAHESSR